MNSSIASNFNGENINIVLMVSGGSDSTALLKMMCAYLSANLVSLQAQSSHPAQLPSSQLNHPSQLDQPDQPSQPDNPYQPSQPDYITRPDQPNQPGQPSQSNNSDSTNLPSAVQNEFEQLVPPNTHITNVHLKVVHVNHLLRGSDAFADEAFVKTLCANLDVPLHVERIDIAALTKVQGAKAGGIEAVARKERYRIAHEQLDLLMARHECKSAYILTAHTLDDRIETFFMRALVGCGPSGLASIPKKRGCIYRPLLDVERESLRQWLRDSSNNMPDHVLWREDKTNSDGSNFRSQVRLELVQKAKELRENFPKSLANTLDLLAEEDAMLTTSAQSLLYRNLSWDETEASMPINAISEQQKPMQRRILREMFLVIDPDARLSSSQIERVADNLDTQNFTTEVSGGIRVHIKDGFIYAKIPDKQCLPE